MNATSENENRGTPAPDSHDSESHGPLSPVRRVIRRVLSGLLFVLPALLTLILIYQLYLIVNAWLIEPVALLIIPSGIENPYWTAVEKYVTPPLTLLAVFSFLYLMGYLFQTRLHRWMQWVIERIPGVSTLYTAINEVFEALQGPGGLKKIDTVVLVPFPHSQSRMVGYLMGESRDETTGQPLACVYVPIGIFPPSGYTMVLPVEQVTLTDWKSAAPWKLLLSGGLTLPATLPYHGVRVPLMDPDAPTPDATSAPDAAPAPDATGPDGERPDEGDRSAPTR